MYLLPKSAISCLGSDFVQEVTPGKVYHTHWILCRLGACGFVKGKIGLSLNFGARSQYLFIQMRQNLKGMIIELRYNINIPKFHSHHIS